MHGLGDGKSLALETVLLPGHPQPEITECCAVFKRGTG
jgi:hypothetical protein